MDIRHSNITIWSVSSLFLSHRISFYLHLSFCMKLHDCGLGCLAMNFSTCVLCHTIVKMNRCHCKMDCN